MYFLQFLVLTVLSTFSMSSAFGEDIKFKAFPELTKNGQCVSTDRIKSIKGDIQIIKVYWELSEGEDKCEIAQSPSNLKCSPLYTFELDMGGSSSTSLGTIGGRKIVSFDHGGNHTDIELLIHEISGWHGAMCTASKK